MNNDTGINDTTELPDPTELARALAHGGRPRETQASIHQWGVQTFGPTNALTIAVRMNLEVIELIEQLVLDYGDAPELDGMRRLLDAIRDLGYLLNAEHAHVPAGPGPTSERARVECADVHIMLRQVAEYLGCQLDAETDRKMAVVRTRQWSRGPEGQMQHVKFRDVGTGLEMEPGLWYVISDSGSAYTPQGFPDSETAVKWCQANSAEYELTGSDITVPTFKGPGEGWDDMGAVNVVLGENCRDFFMAQDPEGWALMNPADGSDPLPFASQQMAARLAGTPRAEKGGAA